MFMRNIKLIAIAAIALFTFYGCVSTQIVSTWVDPAITIKTGDFKKVLVLALVENESSRKIIEDKLVKILKTPCVASYSYLTKEDLAGTLEAAKAKIKNDGFDGIITMRLAKIEQDVNYIPGTYPSHFYSPWSYGAYAAPMYYDPAYYSADNVYNVEINLYMLNPEKLMWTGVTATIEPEKMDKAVNVIAQVAKDKMVEEGFFVEAGK